MVYSTLVCPFWRTPQSRLGKESLRAPGARRGTRAAVLGYEDVCLAVEPGKDLLATLPPPFRFLYVKRCADVQFTDPADQLVDLYQESLERDADLAGDTVRSYWEGDGNSTRRLHDYLSSEVPKLLSRVAGELQHTGERSVYALLRMESTT